MEQHQTEGNGSKMQQNCTVRSKNINKAIKAAVAAGARLQLLEARCWC
jgi:hypothetical protein